MKSGTIRGILIFALCLFLYCAKKEPQCDIIGPASHAFDRAGEISGGYVLPNGVAITPFTLPNSVHFTVERFPMNAIEIPQRNILVVTNNGTDYQSLQVIDLGTNQVKQRIEKTGYSFFLGLAVDASGSKLYASGGAANKIFVYDVDSSGKLINKNSFPVPDFPGGIALSQDGKSLYVAEYKGDFAIIDLTQVPPQIVKSVQTGSRSTSLPFPYPFWVTLNKDGSKAYVSNLGDRSISVIDIQQGVEAKRITVGKNPEGMVLSPDGSRLYVANSDTDDISVIDTTTDSVIATVSVNFESDSPYGATPTSVEISKDGAYLFVSSAGTNSIDVISTSELKVLGRLPTAWYPTRVLLSSDDSKIIVVNAKGYGSGPNIQSEYVGGLNKGVISVFLKDAALSSLETHTNQVIANNNRLSTYYELPCRNINSPIPSEPGRPSPIKHVLFILKENKTYDQVLGDLEGTEADPTLVTFGEKYTPNTHKLAREFSNLDNCYSDAEVSIQGHMWNTASICNDYVERGWLGAPALLPGAGLEPAGYPASNFIFHRLLENNIDFMVYGEAVGILSEYFGVFGMEPIFQGYVDESWPGGPVWTMAYKDEARAKYFADRLAEWEQSGDMPEFIMMLLPNDHTYGVSPGKLTPESMVSDNDYALGLVVEAVSNSKFWKETAIFVTQDDPQSGADHIDAHRTVCLVISPYAKRGYTSRVHYSVPSIFKTMELILGLPPLYQYDQRASPMYDVFTTQPDDTPYTAVPRQHPDEITPKYEKLSPEMKKLADITAEMDFSEPDSIENHELGKVIRRYLEIRKSEGISNNE